MKTFDNRTQRPRVLALAILGLLATTGCGSDDSDGGGVADPVAYFGMSVGSSLELDCSGCDGNATLASVGVDEIDTTTFPGTDAAVWRIRFHGIAQVTRWFDPRPDGLYLLQEEGNSGVEIPFAEFRTFDGAVPLLPAPARVQSREYTVMVNGVEEAHRVDVSEGELPANAGDATEAWRLTWAVTPAGGSPRVAIYDFVPNLGFARLRLSGGDGELVPR